MLKVSFSKKVAIVTGAASGIGRAIAEELESRGAEVIKLDQATLEASDLSFTLDVSDLKAVESLRREILSRRTHIDLLVNCAGVSLAGSIEDSSFSDLDWVMNVNFWGTVNCCKVFAPDLIRSGNGRILNVGSSFGWVGFAGKAG